MGRAKDYVPTAKRVPKQEILEREACDGEVRVQVVYGGRCWEARRDVTDDLPAAVVDEAVTEAVNAAWKAGVDPTLQIVIVTFN